jgi:hypothetical protein
MNNWVLDEMRKAAAERAYWIAKLQAERSKPI